MPMQISLSPSRRGSSAVDGENCTYQRDGRLRPVPVQALGMSDGRYLHDCQQNEAAGMALTV